jgi:proline iminopeptidase
MYCRNSFPSVIGLTFILLFVAACGAPQATSTAIPPTDTPLPTTSSGTVAVDGVELLYVREGSGKPILVVGSAVYYPRAFSPTLREHFELIFVDWRFFVPSYNPPKEELGNVSLDTFVDDLETVRTALGVDNLSVLGHSIHAQIAIGYARKYPQHISHLILVGGTPYALSEWSKEVLR